MPTYYSGKIREVNERNYARDRSRDADNIDVVDIGRAKSDDLNYQVSSGEKDSYHSSQLR